MSPENTQEFRDLIGRFTAQKRFRFDPLERFVILKRWGTVHTQAYATFSEALIFAEGYLSGPHESTPIAFVVDTDPEYAAATLVMHGTQESIANIKSEIRALYSGVVDGDHYAANLIESRIEESRVSAKNATEQEGSVRLFAILAVIGAVLYLIFAR
jgi:hypothetical protein